MGQGPSNMPQNQNPSPAPPAHQRPIKMSEEGKQKLERLEGFKQLPSHDSGTTKSIGYGINSQGQAKVYTEMVAMINNRGFPLTKEEGRQNMDKVLPEYERSVKNLPNSDMLAQSQIDALVSLTYNEGGKNMHRLLDGPMAERDMPAVARAIRTDATQGRSGENLQARRATEADWFEQGLEADNK